MRSARDLSGHTHLNKCIDDHLLASCSIASSGITNPGFRILRNRSTVRSLPLGHCRVLLQVVRLLANSAEVSLSEVVVRMVCLQRFLTQSLICELQHQHHRKMSTYSKSLGKTTMPSDIGHRKHRHDSMLRIESLLHSMPPTTVQRHQTPQCRRRYYPTQYRVRKAL